MKPRFSYDGFANASVEEVSRAVVAVIDAVQTTDPEIQAHAVALAFLLITQQYRVEPQDVFVVVKNLMASTAAGHSIEYRALLDYVKMELTNE